MAYLKKIQSHYAKADTFISFRQPMAKIKNLQELPKNIQDAIKTADHMESKGFQELLGYDGNNKIIWSAGGHWDGHENKPSEKFTVENFGGMSCPSCKHTTIQWSK